MSEKSWKSTCLTVRLNVVKELKSTLSGREFQQLIFFVIVTELSLVAGRARPKTNLFTVCCWLQLRWRLCFTLENSKRQLATANRSRVCIHVAGGVVDRAEFLSNRRSFDHHTKYAYCFSLCACLSVVGNFWHAGLGRVWPLETYSLPNMC